MTGKLMGRILSAALLMLAGLAVLGCVAVSVEKDGTRAADKEHRTMNDKNRIRPEHIAINVEDPVAMAQWYCKNLGMKIVREGPAPASARFIADAGSRIMLEIYHNPPDAVPDYASLDPLVLHIAFMVDNVNGICRKLVAAGATVVQDVYSTDSGDEIAMLRDPWGVPIQFLKRAKPMLSYE